jgi:hypothetical protein
MTAPVLLVTLASHAAGKKGHVSISEFPQLRSTENQKWLQETASERARRPKLFRADV